MKDVPDRQHSLRAAFNYSWRMLPERERHIFQQLSIFRGVFTREAAQAITAASLQDLQGLVNKSMLTVVPEGRYEIHELLRQFGAEMLARWLSSKQRCVCATAHITAAYFTSIQKAGIMLAIGHLSH